MNKQVANICPNLVITDQQPAKAAEFESFIILLNTISFLSSGERGSKKSFNIVAKDINTKQITVTKLILANIVHWMD